MRRGHNVWTAILAENNDMHVSVHYRHDSVSRLSLYTVCVASATSVMYGGILCVEQIAARTRYWTMTSNKIRWTRNHPPDRCDPNTQDVMSYLRHTQKLPLIVIYKTRIHSFIPISFLCSRRRSSSITKCARRVSQERFDLESPNFTGTFRQTSTTAMPDMTSLATIRLAENAIE